MPENIDSHRIRQVILEIVNRESKSGNLQTASVLHQTLDALGLQGNLQTEQALLTIWHDLFRTGHLAWGLNLSNPNPPHCHVTEQGRRTLQNLSRDPANPDGYLAHVSQIGVLDEVTESYVREALKTYNSDCFKATAVMIGAAAESLILELRDTMIQRMRSLGQNPPSDLKDWRLKKVLDSLERLLSNQSHNMDRDLAEAVQQFWPAFTGQIRQARNEAGHPTSIEPVTHETVHASLLIFPELLSLAYRLKAWVTNNMQ
jgi:hypothetical protein